ncbi:MAG TPA: tetratricopeptide repeat protein, partial [Isosphaeraceae bacterium]
MNDRTRWRLRWAGAALAVAALGVLVGVVVVRRFGGDRLPGPGSEVYREMVSAFFAGVAALDVDANDRAQASLTRATQMVPEEPAAWADRGLLGIRQGDFEAAAHDLERARELAPDSGAVERLLGLLEGRRGRFAEAITHLRRAVQLEPEAIKTRYELAQEVERQGGPDGEAEAGRLHEEILRLRPGNLAVLLERARLAVKRGDAEALGDVVARLGPRAESWPPRAREQYRALREAAANDLRLAATRVAFLRNVLLAVPAFRQDLDALQTPPGTVGEPIERFLRLAEPAPTPAPPDEGLAFAVEPLATPDATRWDAVLAVSLTGEGPPALFLADGREVRRADAPGVVLPFPGGPKPEPPSSRGILALDWDSDYRTDLVLAGAGGLKLFRQTPEGAFADATAGAGLDAGLVGADYFGAWAADIEADGDLDIVLGPRQGAPAVLRNHGDGTFGVLHPFAGVAGLRDFAWADVDADGDPDAGL